MKVVIVPCTREKVWDAQPGLGPIPAKDAYTGRAFRDWRRYAEERQKDGARWFMLSTRHGLLDPDTPITTYNVAVSAASRNPEFLALLRRQGEEHGLVDCEVILLDWETFAQFVNAATGGSRACHIKKLRY